MIDSKQHTSSESKQLETVRLNGEQFFKITNHHQMRPFFMCVVSDSNHWMFISSNGGLTAGRKNADFALFPYYTDDKITESAHNTGPISIFRVKKDEQTYLWEPFRQKTAEQYNISRNLYKNKYGNKILFEEINHELQLSFCYQWSSSNEYGFVRHCFLRNLADQQVEIQMLDGVQNILPAGVPSDLQNASSNLVDAYKRTELEINSGMAIIALSAVIVDRAEPSEALKANIAWSSGLQNPTYLLSTLQLDSFRKSGVVQAETDKKAEKAAYLLQENFSLSADQEKTWRIVLNVNQNASEIEALVHAIQHDEMLEKTIEADIHLGTERLIRKVAASDGLQLTYDPNKNARHYSNTLFNIMRGGIFDHNYMIEKWDFENYLKKANKKVYKSSEGFLQSFDDLFTYQYLIKKAKTSGDEDLLRLATEYLPLMFSRRHGDPSRPWNRFSINTRSEVDGSKILDYEGNWRDIFQNWEALAHSYPQFIEGMIHKFLNASTADGYNPYRVTKDGFDWETIEPDDAWSYIGYWGDHQIIYLQKFLEIIESHFPGKLEEYFTNEIFVYANVPYKIKAYEQIVENPKDTILFDAEADHAIRSDRARIGADGALVRSESDQIYRVNIIEKLLVSALAKLSNFVPEAGIWLNTQRPEWNDANNALVGNGVSMVTLYYLRRFFSFVAQQLTTAKGFNSCEISTEVHALFSSIFSALRQNRNLLSSGISDQDRKSMLDSLGKAGSDYRAKIYGKGFSAEKKQLQADELSEFCQLVLEYLDHSIVANKREDGMYHAYNLITIEDKSVSIDYLDEMLEGQVAVLSSGYLNPEQSLEVLDALKNSKLFREDQYSYLLYPNKNLPGFLQKNNVPADSVESSGLLQEMLKKNDGRIIQKDIKGQYHFNANFRNAAELKSVLNELTETTYGPLVEKEELLLLKIYEKVFNHKAFTGRSGTFYGYEGLGSIYWHMVSKLLLASKECSLQAINEKADAGIIGRQLEHFYEIYAGIGVHKPVDLYGAFPIDPYSHTPMGKGAQQPGMTGQVKEDILSRMGELGVEVLEGEINFHPVLLRAEEFNTESVDFTFYNLMNEEDSIQLPANSLAFTYCQIPVVYTKAKAYEITLKFKRGTSEKHQGNRIDKNNSTEIFARSGKVESIHVTINEEDLK